MREYKPVRKVFPNDDIGLFGIEVRVGWTGHISLIIAKHVIGDLPDRDTGGFQFG
jgi:hypothetical protein